MPGIKLRMLFNIFQIFFVAGVAALCKAERLAARALLSDPQRNKPVVYPGNFYFHPLEMQNWVSAAVYRNG